MMHHLITIIITNLKRKCDIIKKDTVFFVQYPLFLPLFKKIAKHIQCFLHNIRSCHIYSAQLKKLNRVH